ncbi:MAG: hypothetical protein U1F10_13040 [Burkholderiales bacterium]
MHSELRGNVALVQISGRLEREEEAAIARELLAHAAGLRAKGLLVDQRTLQNRGRPSAVYHLTRDAAHRWHHIPVAILDLPANREAAEFQEIAASNLGLEVRAFFAFDEALAWVISRAEPTAESLL